MMSVLSQQSFTNETMQHQFYPYDNNSGSIVAIAGEDFVVIASDMRLTTGYSIFSRNQSKLFKLSNNAVLGTSGCWADVLTFRKYLEARTRMYKFEHNTDIDTPALAQLISNMLYFKRFFPYYISTILAGLDENGKGCVYHYDPIGNFEKAIYKSAGSSSALLQPLLDNQIGRKNIEGGVETKPSLSDAVTIIKDVFLSAAERDIHTGDGVNLTVITPDGIKEEVFPLRRD
ncbi:proteasome subunit beta type-1-B-like [Centruroides sculpturatus]|uniref:proteasome subunit beta type-1-B-like n=2 Tax=Centruroides sculpturatus TaxID=218467 RepID=UPI000C6C9F8A|nr:proteasome subunit beta type-1-B-like [Centruroides sculpturatus]